MLIDLLLNFSIFARLYSMSQAGTIESRICFILCLISSNTCCLRFTFPCFSRRDRFIVKLACGFLHTKIIALLHKPKDEWKTSPMLTCRLFELSKKTVQLDMGRWLLFLEACPLSSPESLPFTFRDTYSLHARTCHFFHSATLFCNHINAFFNTCLLLLLGHPTKSYRKGRNSPAFSFLHLHA